VKVGEAYYYKVGGALVIIRKERNYYVAFVEKSSSFLELDELPYRVLMSTFEDCIKECVEWIAEEFSVSEQSAGLIFGETQSRLADIGFLDMEHIQRNGEYVEVR